MKKNARITSLCLGIIFSLLLFTVPAEAAPDMEVDAGAAVLYDADYDVILFDQHAGEKMYPSGLVKIMTLLLAVEAVERGEISLADPVTVSTAAINSLPPGAFTLNIRAGDVLSVEELLYCAMVGSSNEACNVLAEAVSGNIDAFVSLMNRKAGELQLQNTRFSNPTGLHDENQYATAYDIVLLTKEALNHELFRTIVSADEYTVQAPLYSGQRFFYTSNYLLSAKKIPGYVYRHAFGVRTGYSTEAGSCLAAAAEKNGRTLISVVLNAANGTQPDGSYKLKSFSESSRLLEWGFSHYSLKTILLPTSLLGEVPVTLSQDADYVVIHPESELKAMLPNDVDVSKFERHVTLFQDSVEAPVAKGQVLGTVTLTYEGREYGTINVVALTDVERSDLLYKIQRTKDFFNMTLVRLSAVFLLLFLAAVLVYSAVSGSRRDKKRRTAHKHTYLSYRKKSGR